MPGSDCGMTCQMTPSGERLPVSGQPIATVMAVYIHLLVSASRNVTTCHGVSLRGHIDVTTEDLASALDVTEDVIDSILHAMQGRVLDGDLISGWENVRC